MALKPMVTPDPAYLDRPEEMTPHGLALEMQTMRIEMENLAVPLGPQLTWGAASTVGLWRRFSSWRS